MTDIRNVAIIAHVDHGKTTLVDHMLRQTGAFRSNQEVAECVLDSGAIERERGITILAKNTSVFWKGIKINIVDTPGHQDFGGEVERVLRMADGALLLVDAADGPMPQTRFVLRKALANGLRPIVVVNKLDRPEARPQEVVEEVFYLFMELEATDEQLEFPVVYAIGREGRAKRHLKDPWDALDPLFETIVRHVPPPSGSPDEPLQMRVCTIDYSDYVGRMGIGRVERGRAKTGDAVTLLKRDGRRIAGAIEELSVFVNLRRERVEEAPAGEIVCVSGLPEVDIGDTFAGGPDPQPLPFPRVEEPTLALVVSVNDSPFAGREGKFITSRHLRERLMRETLSDVALRVEPADGPDSFRVCGRGLLHLGILLETMRREGYEFQVSKPEILLREIDGETCEPVELATVDVPQEYVGRCIELFGARRGVVERADPRGDHTLLRFRIPSRGLVGLHSRLMSITRGRAVLHAAFEGYEPWKGDLPGRGAGVLIAMEDGEATTYALDNLQSRGVFFVTPGTKVYEGMIVGEHVKDRDLVVNVAKKRRLTNMRTSTADSTVVLAQPRLLALEEALEYIEEDERVEITPQSIRLRKKVLSRSERKRLGREAAVEEI